MVLSKINPKVSVIIPVYERPLSVLKSIQSVLAQTYEHWELIIVDDGSKDPFMLEGDHPKIKIIRHKENRGAASARNTGIKNSKAELIAFLDSDDVWHPEKLELQVKALKNTSHHVGGCITSYHLITGHKKRTKHHKIKNFYLQSLSGEHMSIGSTLLFKKTCLKEVGFQNTDVARLEDWEWQINFARYYNWISIEKPLVSIHIASYPSFEKVYQSLNIIKRRQNLFTNYEKKIFMKRYYYELALSGLFNNEKRVEKMVFISRFFLSYLDLVFFIFLKKVGFRKSPSQGNTQS